MNTKEKVKKTRTENGDKKDMKDSAPKAKAKGKKHISKNVKDLERSKMNLEGHLPQNVLQIGDNLHVDKKIYIAQPTYKQIKKFTKNKTLVETGGVLIGRVIEEFGKVNIIIEGFIEAKNSEGTPTTLTFTHESWDYIHGEMKSKYPSKKILGWIHTHPDFGIFLSDYDKFIQENFFNEENQIAYVIDPIREEEGFYYWINGKLESCEGFFVYDKTGKPIKLDANDKKEEVQAPSTVESPRWMKVSICVLTALVTILLFINIGINGKIKMLQNQVDQISLMMFYTQNGEELTNDEDNVIVIDDSQDQTKDTKANDTKDKSKTQKKTEGNNKETDSNEKE